MLAATAKSAARRSWADWVGFLYGVALAGLLLWRASSFNLLLLPTLLHELVIAAGFLLRGAPRARLSGPSARIVSYGTALLVPAAFAVSKTWFPDRVPELSVLPLRIAGTVLWLLGSIFGVWGVWTLRRAISIEPQARTLVTDGPYRLARHPIYSAYLLQYAGILLMRPSWALAVIMVAWLCLLVARIRLEESVLGATFPAYAVFQRQVGMFTPRWNIGSLAPRQVAPGPVQSLSSRSE
jgi:protein-S-isoprenylcysteine O-methyltransferase Ste14